MKLPNKVTYKKGDLGFESMKEYTNQSSNKGDNHCEQMRKTSQRMYLGKMNMFCETREKDCPYGKGFDVHLEGELYGTICTTQGLIMTRKQLPSQKTLGLIMDLEV